MLFSPSVAVKGPFSLCGCISLSLFTFFALFFSSSSSSEASVVGSSSFKGLQSRFHTNSFPTTCAAPHLSGFHCELAPWYSNVFTEFPLTPSFTPTCADYSIIRPFSHTYSLLRVHIGVAIPVEAKITIFLNGQVVVTPILSASIDLVLFAGINTCEIHVAVGACISIYKIKINVAVLVVGEILPPYPNCNSCPPTVLDSFSLALTAAGSSPPVPLVCAPFPLHGPHDFIAYEGLAVFVGGKIHLTLNFHVGLWVRYSINGGVWVYVSVSGLEILAALQVGTNLIRIDLIRPGPCGYEIVCYTITICEGPGPVALPPPNPTCPPLELISLDLKGCISLLGIVQSLIPIPLVIQAGLFDYVVVRPLGVTAVKLLLAVQVDVIIKVYLNGVIFPHPVTAGVAVDLILALGVNIIKIDLIKGDCITHYACTIN